MGTQTKSRIVPAQRKKGGLRQNKHVYQGFHDRVATLTINPVQKARQPDERSTESYLKARLEFWKDTNLSKNFVEFTREFDPLCDSLAQILHNEQRIFDLLNRYIEKNDEHSLEALLDLLSQFAHDLGSRFEKFFATSLKSITTLVSQHQVIEVIEWSFNTLSWLFQYLSKLLIPDLRPTYDALAPLLGKQVRKEHVARFAAEAMSFLVRKAANKSRSDTAPLERIVHHMLQDWSGFRESQSNEDIYGYGLMNLFADAMKDVQGSHGIKMHGLPVYKLLLHESLMLGNVQIAVGVTTSLIHHTTASTFSSVLAIILDQINHLGPDTKVNMLLEACRILYTVTSVRRGDRVSSWDLVFDAAEHLLKLLAAQAATGRVFSTAPTLLVASIVQMASYDKLVPRLQRTVELLSDDKDLFNFPLFCLFAWEINEGRFHELLKPYMFRYMAHNWQEGDVRMLFTAQTMINLDFKTIRTMSPSTRVHFKNWPEDIAHVFENWRHSDQTVIQADAMLDLASLLSTDSPIRQSTANALKGLIIQSLTDPMSWSPTERRFFLGGGLSWYLEHQKAHTSPPGITWNQLFSAQHDHGSMPMYLANLSKLLDVETGPQEVDVTQYSALTQNLATASRALRSTTMELLNKLYKLSSGNEAAALRTSIAIENTPADHHSLRLITQQVARLPNEYATTADHPWLGKAIVNYLFGLLTIRLAPVWKESTDALRQIYDSGRGDGVQLLEDVAFRWLETRHHNAPEDANEADQAQSDGPVNEFQCTNVRKWQQTIERWESDLSHTETRLGERFDSKHTQVQPVPLESAAQALRVLAAIPALAERRSRRLVPLFLRWASADEDSEATLLGSVSPDTENDNLRSGLARRDQKTMLDVFGLFNNPSVLHQSGEVYNALLRLLGNGDVQMQKAALKALMTWKLPAVRKYQEELGNLLDNARFREELVVFLPSQTDKSGLPSSQRHELMRVLLRLLYGRIIARGSAGAGRASQTARRKAVFEALGSFPQKDLTAFVDIVLGPLKHLTLKDGVVIAEDPTMQVQFPIRKQMGFVKLAKDLLDSLGDKLEHLARPLLNAILYCLANVKTARDEPLEDKTDEEDPVNMSSVQKAVRQGALQCLVRCFRSFKSLDIESYALVIELVVIKPRIGPQFAAENSQSVSSTMHLFSVWAARPDSKILLLVNTDLLFNILECLNVDSGLSGAKSEVKIFILEQIMRPLIQDLNHTLEPRLTEGRFYETLLQRSAGILEQRGAKPLLASAVSTILQVANTGAGEDIQSASDRWSPSISGQLVGVFRTLLEFENQVVSGPTKSEALAVLARFLPSLTAGESTSLVSQLYLTLAKMFSTAKHPEMRAQLTRTFKITADLIGGKAPEVAVLCNQLNAVSMGRLDEPDYDEREKASEIVADANGFGDDEWTPLVYNALFFIKDGEELIVRKGGARMLRRFIETNNTTEQSGDVVYPTSRLLRGVLLPALRRGASERSELVRVEYLNVMAHLVKCCPQWSEIKDMTALTTSSDDSESFFEGVLHIQQDWRKRSLIKLARVSRQGQLGSSNTAHYLLPLVEQFVFDRAEDNDAHSLSAQAVLTIGAMISSLDWTQARKTLKRYSGVIKDKPDLEKAVIRLIGVTTDAILTSHRSDDASAVLKRTIPAGADLSGDVENKLLPPLANFLRHRDENVVSLRVPIAVSAARLICLLPEDLLEYKLAPVLTDVCNILRSQAQDSRDLSRKTLSEIAALIGASKFGFILKELRVALSRGKQLHVLSYTLHSLLVESNFKPGELDYCLPEIMRIVLDDTFGAAGQEKDADGYTNKAKEVKGSKSMDTAERMAKITTVGHLEDFTAPIQRFLTEKLDARSTTKMDELLRRIRSGLEQNESIGSQSTLVFCYKVLNQARVSASNAKPTARTLTRQEQQKKNTFEIQSKGAKKAPILPRVSSQQYKFARFALDLLREVLRRHESLRTSANLSGFLTPVGDVLLDAQEEVQTSALRFLASIIKVPMHEWKENVPVYADTAFKMLQNQPDTNTELSQAALKLLAAVIRDRTELSLKDRQLSWLIKAVIPDLTQPAAQGVTFNFFKAVIQRHIVTNEVYEAMDAIAKLFITYGDGGARNQARSIWLQFVTTYEQSEKRFDQQIAFMTQNLDYKHSEGRQSMMEAINFLLGRLDRDHLQKAILALFIPTMTRFIGDENAACRDMAGLLLKTIATKADNDSLQIIRKALHNYLGRDDKHALQTAALRVFASIVEADSERAKKDLPPLLDRIQEILTEALQSENADWELPYHALQLVSTLCDAYSRDMLSPKLQQLWDTVYQLSSFPHAWVKFSAAKLTRTLFDSLDSNQNPTPGVLQTTSGVKIDHADLCRLTRSYFRTMLRRDVQDWLVAGLTQNLETLDRTAGGLAIIDDGTTDGEDDDQDDDDDEAGDDKEDHATQTLREYSLSRISAIVRRDSPLIAKRAALQLLASIVDRMTKDEVELAALEVLRPLSHLTDLSISRTVQADVQAKDLQDQLGDQSNEITTVLQKKLPEGSFVNTMHKVQQEAKQRREERRGKRRIEAVTNPEKYSKDKAKKRMKGRDRRQERNVIERSKRRGY